MFDSASPRLLACTLLRTFHEETETRSNSCRRARHPEPPDDIAARRQPCWLHYECFRRLRAVPSISPGAETTEAAAEGERSEAASCNANSPNDSDIIAVVRWSLVESAAPCVADAKQLQVVPAAPPWRRAIDVVMCNYRQRACALGNVAGGDRRVPSVRRRVNCVAGWGGWCAAAASRHDQLSSSVGRDVSLRRDAPCCCCCWRQLLTTVMRAPL